MKKIFSILFLLIPFIRFGQTKINSNQINTSQTISLANISAIGNNSIGVQTIRVKASTTITLKTNLTTGIGSITFDAGGYIKKDY